MFRKIVTHFTLSPLVDQVYKRCFGSTSEIVSNFAFIQTWHVCSGNRLWAEISPLCLLRNLLDGHCLYELVLQNVSNAHATPITAHVHRVQHDRYGHTFRFLQQWWEAGGGMVMLLTLLWSRRELTGEVGGWLIIMTPSFFHPFARVILVSRLISKGAAQTKLNVIEGLQWFLE